DLFPRLAERASQTNDLRREPVPPLPLQRMLHTGLEHTDLETPVPGREPCRGGRSVKGDEPNRSTRRERFGKVEGASLAQGRQGHLASNALLGLSGRRPALGAPRRPEQARILEVDKEATEQLRVEMKTGGQSCRRCRTGRRGGDREQVQEQAVEADLRRRRRD